MDDEDGGAQPEMEYAAILCRLKVKPKDHQATLVALSAMDSVWNANGDANERGNIVPTGKN